MYIQGEDSLGQWKNHFKDLLNAEPLPATDSPPITSIFERSLEIQQGDFTQAEVNTTVHQMKIGMPGLDDLPSEFWKLPKIKKQLRKFCNQAYNGNRPKEWGEAALVPIPKKGDLTKCSNYRGIALSQVSAKIYNRLLNRIRPVVDKLLRPNQNGFRPQRSTSAHILALRRIVEELHNHEMEAAIVFIDFRKAFDSIDRNKMFQILEAYGIPTETIEAIKVMYQDTTAVVITPECLTDKFFINTGVLQGDPLAPLLFIICLDYAMRMALNNSDGLTLHTQKSKRKPAEKLSDLDFADDIALLSDSLADAQAMLNRVEQSCQAVGLHLNSTKTKFMHINPKANAGQLKSSKNEPIELVSDFKYLGGYTATKYDIKYRTGQAWAALNALSKIWKSPICQTTKTRIFKSTVESILLYSCESWALTKNLEKTLDGNYTRMLRKVYNIPWQSHTTNRVLYGNLPRISSIVRKRRLVLGGHVNCNAPPGSSKQAFTLVPRGKKTNWKTLSNCKSNHTE